jgi:hypothetical protein
MSRRATLAFLVAIAAGCRSQPAASPITADQVTEELVDAGCLAPGAGDVDAVAAELATGHDPWLACLFDGGSIAGCNVPCERAGYVRRPVSP